MTSELKLFTDGGSRGNPGSSACAYAIFDLEGKLIEKSGFYLGITTNNNAEYKGLIHGLERAKALGAENVSVFMDSELVTKQVNGQYRVKNQDLKPLFEKAKELAGHFPKINFSYVPREQNQVADAEVNRILDEQGK